MSSEVRTRIGVFPATAATQRQRLLGVLEQAFPVRFEGRTAGEWLELDAAIFFEGEPEGNVLLPALVMGRAGTGGPAGQIVLTEATALDRRLRGTELPERGLGTVEALAAAPGDEVLAVSRAGPVWLLRRERRHAALAPEELAEGEPLRDRLRPGRFLALLPLVHFLKEVCAEQGWTAPPPRAAFVVDDPNLHWTSYGYLRYAELVEHADRHGYHVAFATVPLDGWFSRTAAADLLRARPDRLSLLVHGNDHVRAELGQERTESEAVAIAAQALRRVAAFERRSGVPVDRVMAPPHGACSAQTMRALLLTGFEALCKRPPHPGVEGPLAGWEPVDLAAGGLPVLPRTKLADRSELALEAFLDRPLVLYGHHEDFASGLDVLAEATGHVDRLGDVRWSSLGTIARSSFLSRRAGGRLELRLHGRRITLDVSRDVEEIVVRLPPGHSESELETVVAGGASARFADGAAVLRGVPPGRLDLSLVRDDAVDVQAVPAPPWRPWPLARRLLTEGRDRIRPLVARPARTSARS